MIHKRGAPPKKRACVHRLLQTRTDEGSAHGLSSSTPTPFGIASEPLFTPPSTPVLSTPVATTPSSTPPATTPSSTPPATTPSSMHAATNPSSTPATTAPSSSSVATESSEQNGYLLGSILLDGRVCVGIRAKQLFPTGKCAVIIHSSFIDRVDPSGYKWSTLSPEIIQFYWEEFQKHCYWDSGINSLVRSAWEDKAKDRYRQYIYNMRSTKRNPTHKRPMHVHQDVWTSWNTIWNNEEFKKKSMQNKTNRCKGVVGGRALPTHNGGSASHLKIADDMEKRSGHPPSIFDVFIYTHTKDHDGKSFIVDKAQQVHDNYEPLRNNLVAIGEEVEDNDLYYKAVGGHDRKKRLYGVGSYGKSIVPTTNSFETYTSPHPNSYQHEVNTKVQKLEEIVEQQQVFIKKLEERHEETMTILQGLGDMVKAFTSK